MSDISEKLREIEAERDAALARAEKAEHDPAVADAVYQAKLLVRLRDRFILISEEIEDEGDRAFFGSTNDADDFKQIVDELDKFTWSRIMERSEGRDLYAEMRQLRLEKEAAESALSAAQVEIERLTTDREYIVGWSDGFDYATEEDIRFPVMLRKMWSGGEVQRWLTDEFSKRRAAKRAARAMAGEE